MLANIAQVAGLVAITIGAALITPVAGFIVGGVLLVLLGISLTRSA